MCLCVHVCGVCEKKTKKRPNEAKTTSKKPKVALVDYNVPLSGSKSYSYYKLRIISRNRLNVLAFCDFELSITKISVQKISIY